MKQRLEQIFVEWGGSLNWKAVLPLWGEAVTILSSVSNRDSHGVRQGLFSAIFKWQTDCSWVIVTSAAQTRFSSFCFRGSSVEIHTILWQKRSTTGFKMPKPVSISSFILLLLVFSMFSTSVQCFEILWRISGLIKRICDFSL